MNPKRRHIKKIGKCPINARITVDYSQKKPKITFDYIAQKQQMKDIHFNPVSMFITIFLFGIIGYSIAHSPPEVTIYPKNCSFEYNQSSQILWGYNITCLEGNNYTFNYEPGVGHPPFGLASRFVAYAPLKLFFFDYDIKVHTPSENLTFMLISVITVFSLYIFALILFYYTTCLIGLLMHNIGFTRKMNSRLIPELNKKLSRVRYSAMFTKCPDTRIIEIPLFKNVFLDYEAKGEFSKYLLRMEIREHPFNQMLKKKKRYLRKKNVNLWHAKFYFKEVPKTGWLEVRWK